MKIQLVAKVCLGSPYYQTRNPVNETEKYSWHQTGAMKRLITYPIA
jgi:hypothetical protein